MINETMKHLGEKRSCIRELFEYGKMQKEIVGEDNVYDFSIGNPSTEVPKEIVDTMKNLLDNESLKVHAYTSAHGCLHARKQVAKNLSERSKDTIRAENIFFTCGAAPAIISCIKALAVENAEVLLIAPYFAEYPVYAGYNGVKTVVVEADRETFQINFEDLKKKISNNTQAIIVNSPNNPSGVVYSAETLKKLASILKEGSEKIGHPIYIIADEPYRELVYDGVDVPYLPFIYPDTLICYSYSKSLSMPGERIGYVCIPDCATDGQQLYYAIAGAARTLGHVCAPSLMQWAIADNAQLWPDITVYNNNRNKLYKELSEMGYRCIKPMGAFYMMIEAPGGDSLAFCEVAKQENLLLVPCDDFGCPGYMRISTCVSEDMVERSLKAFKKAIAKYQ